MSDEVQAQDATEEAAETENTQDVVTDSQEPGTAESVDQLPEWAQKLIKDTRAEAAKYRTEKTKAQKEAEAKSRQQAEEQGKFKELYEAEKTAREQAEQARQAAEIASLKSTVAHKLSLPAALVDRLRGETLEELAADAQTLLDAMPKAQPSTKTDGQNGTNARASTPKMTDQEIKEKAARLNVPFTHLKAHYIEKGLAEAN